MVFRSSGSIEELQILTAGERTGPIPEILQGIGEGERFQFIHPFKYRRMQNDILRAYVINQPASGNCDQITRLAYQRTAVINQRTFSLELTERRTIGKYIISYFRDTGRKCYRFQYFLILENIGSEGGNAIGDDQIRLQGPHGVCCQRPVGEYQGFFIRRGPVSINARKAIGGESIRPHFLKGSRCTERGNH